MRKRITFTLDEEILEKVQQSKNGRSASERVNELLKRAFRAERRDQLEREAAAFFALPETAEERKERKAFEKAALETLAHD
jgi:Arc/MetJ family transcription regulator